ncbi:MAG: HNH endonuclease [Beijerinckiaceae bacterium]
MALSKYIILSEPKWRCCMIVIQYHGVRGYREIYSPSMFERDDVGVVHSILGPRGRHYQAKFDVRVDGNSVELDYGKHIEFNSESCLREDCVTWRFEFKDEKSLVVQKIERKSTAGWEPVEFTCSFDFLDEFEGAWSSEGQLSSRVHFIRERDRFLVQRKLNEARKKNGKIKCEACCDTSEQKYGPNGPVWEVHHLNPLTEGERKTCLHDLAILCPNCHRAIHAIKSIQGQLMSVKELSARIDQYTR